MKRNLFHAVCFLILLFAGVKNACSQSVEAQPFRLDLQFGGRMVHRKLQPLTNNLDFLNYLNGGGNGNSIYGVMRLGLSFAPSDRWKFDIGLGVFSDLLSSQLNIQAARNIKAITASWGWGILTEFEIYPQYIDEYNQYHIITDVNLIGDLDKNYRQNTLYDMGFSVRPFLRYTGEKLNFCFSTGPGLNAFRSFDVNVTQKKPQGNLRREIRYETNFNPVLTSHSGAEVSYTFCHSEKISFGILAKAEVLIGSRNITYTRTVSTWTAENPLIENIHPDKTFYSKTEITGGVFVKF